MATGNKWGHFFSKVSEDGIDTFLHGTRLPRMMTIEANSTLAGYRTYLNILSGIPIINPGAAATSDGSYYNCFTAAMSSLGRGMEL